MAKQTFKRYETSAQKAFRLYEREAVSLGEALLRGGYVDALDRLSKVATLLFAVVSNPALRPRADEFRAAVTRFMDETRDVVAGSLFVVPVVGAKHRALRVVDVAAGAPLTETEQAEFEAEPRLSPVLAGTAFVASAGLVAWGAIWLWRRRRRSA